MGGDRKADDRMTRSSMSSRRAGRTAAHAIATLVGLLLVVPGLYIASARDPRSGDAFEYDHNIYLDRGTGEYDGYSETTRAHSTYRVLSTSGDNSTVLAPGSWSWQASDGNRQSGMLDVQISFSVTTRRYLAGIDVEGNYSDPAVWFWISTPAVAGQVHHILDDDLTVAIEIDGDDLLRAPVGEPATVIVPPGGLTEREAGHGDSRVRHRRLSFLATSKQRRELRN